MKPGASGWVVVARGSRSEWARRVGDGSRVATELPGLRNRVAPCSPRRSRRIRTDCGDSRPTPRSRATHSLRDPLQYGETINPGVESGGFKIFRLADDIAALDAEGAEMANIRPLL